jgi:hypothetical protein
MRVDLEAHWRRRLAATLRANRLLTQVWILTTGTPVAEHDQGDRGIAPGSERFFPFCRKPRADSAKLRQAFKMGTNQAGNTLARISHHSSTVAALCGIPGDFHSVGALNSGSTMPAHSSVAKDTWDTTFHRLATKGGEKCGLAPAVQLTCCLATSTIIRRIH